MNEEAISYIMQKMSNCLDNSQMISLEKTLEEALRGEDIVSLKPSEELLEEFLSVNMLRKMGEQCEVDHVHPHKFRRTMATTAECQSNRYRSFWDMRKLTPRFITRW